MATEAQKKANKKYREKVNRTTIDFYPSEDELWDHLNFQPNKQGYIKSLIRADMEKTIRSETSKQVGNYIDLMFSLKKEEA